MKRHAAHNKGISNSSASRRLFGFAAAGVSLAAFGAPTHAQTVILSDDFTNAGGPASGLVGTTPDGINLGGGQWVITGVNDYDNRISSSSSYFPDYPNFASSRNGTSAGISVQSSGSYVEPYVLNISAGVSPVGPAQPGNSNNLTDPVAVLGFYSTSYSAHYQSDCYHRVIGLTLDANGALDFIAPNGSGGFTMTPAGVPTVSFDADGFATLSYTETYDPVSTDVTISNIVVDGTSYSNTYTTLPQSADTLNYAGIGGTSDGFPMGASFTNLLVTTTPAAVPEPGTFAMSAAGALSLGAYQYRRRRQSGRF
jgi:hypothetical protein